MEAEYYNKLFKENTDMSRYENIYKKIGTMTQETVDIGCGLAELRKHIKKYKGFDIADEIIPKGCKVGNAYDKKNYKGKIFTATEVLEHLDDLKVIKNIPVAARFIFTVPTFDDPAHLRTYNENDIKNLPGLKIKSITRFGWEDKWIEGHEKGPYIYLVDSKRIEPEISVSMIVKNEEKCLRKALESIKDADEIVIVDTGSTDKTVDIAKEYTDKVYTDYKWENHFARARNVSLNRCTKDWVLAIDADEELISSISDVKEAILNTKHNALNLNVFSGKESMMNIRLFKRKEGKWLGAAHNYLTGLRAENSNLKLKYGYSPTHLENPDRTLNILLENHDSARDKFYLAREYLYKKDYKNALKWYKRYIKESTFKAEICEAYLQMARCKWYTGKGQEARNYCLKAIEGNPNFKEALLLMAEMSWEPQAKVWKKFAEIATNQNVLFVRNKDGK